MASPQTEKKTKTKSTRKETSKKPIRLATINLKRNWKHSTQTFSFTNACKHIGAIYKLKIN